MVSLTHGIIAGMQILVPATLTGTGVALTVASAAGVNSAKWFQLTGVTIAAAASRIGDANVSATRGYPLTAGGGQFFPPVARANAFYDLTQIYFDLAIGDTANLMVCIGG